MISCGLTVISLLLGVLYLIYQEDEEYKPSK